jgi:adenylate kinase family enzyme
VTEPARVALGQRILVWGGGGKSTLARALGCRLELPVVELDALHWLPGWMERDQAEFQALALKAVEDCGRSWIVDGQYTSRIGSRLLARADTLIWLDLPWRVIFWRVATRGVRRSFKKNRICGDNVDSWRRAFLTRDSLLYWHIGRLLSGAHRQSVATKAALIEADGRNATVIRLRTRRQLREFYRMQDLARRPE